MKRLCYVLSAALFAILAMTACSQDSLLDESEVDMSSKVELNGQELANNLLASFRNGITRNGDAIYPDYYGGMCHNIAGIHAAGITSSSGKTAVFIPASSINRALSLTMY